MQQQTDGKGEVCGYGGRVGCMTVGCGRSTAWPLGRSVVLLCPGSGSGWMAARQAGRQAGGQAGTETIHHPYDKQSKAIVLSSSSLLLN